VLLLRREEDGMSKKRAGKQPSGNAGLSGFGGFLGGLGALVDKLGELAETGEELRKSGEIGRPGDKVRGVYGFSVKVGLGDEGVKIERFGNVSADERTGRAVVHEVSEPIADVFEEEGYVLVVAEMAGVGEEDIRLELKDDILTISAERGKKKYRKEVLVLGSFSPERMTYTCGNGILEVRLEKQTPESGCNGQGE